MKRLVATWYTKNTMHGTEFDETNRHSAEYAVSEILNALRSYANIDLTTLKITEVEVSENESDD